MMKLVSRGGHAGGGHGAGHGGGHAGGGHGAGRGGRAAPAKAAPARPAPVKAAPVKPAPVKPAPVKAAPVKPAPVKAAPVKPVPVKAAPAKPVPVKAAPAKPVLPSKAPTVPPIRPDPGSIDLVRARKEALSRQALSVRDQAIGRVVSVVASERGIATHEAGKVITSLYRSNSEAHKRGAFDISLKTSKNVAQEASKIRDSLGKGFLVIHEQPASDNKTQTNTYYCDDGTSRSVTKPYGTPGFKATGPHIHVQPQKEIFDKG
jgi:hypothetical protein